jgi:DNA-binding NtrC family response regulator
MLLRKKMNADPCVVLGGAAATICVVDDDPSMLKALERLLLSVGLSARFFREPLDFLTYATLNPVQVALIDIWLPGMSGLELQKQLGAVSPETRVIVVTADDEDSVRSAAIQNGATAFFAKPFENDIFLDAIKQAMAFDEPEAAQFGGRLTSVVGTSTKPILLVADAMADRFEADPPPIAKSKFVPSKRAE